MNPPVAPASVPDLLLGATFGVIVLLLIGGAFVYHGVHRESAVERKSFLWGGFLFSLLLTIAQRLPGVRDRVDRVFDALVGLVDIPQPDWMGTEWNPRILWAALGIVGYFFATRILKIRMPWHDKKPSTTSTRRGPRPVPNRDRRPRPVHETVDRAAS